jgi:hypothetical protein
VAAPADIARRRRSACEQLADRDSLAEERRPVCLR